MTKEPAKKAKSKELTSPLKSQGHKMSFWKRKDKLLMKEIVKINKRESCKEVKGSNPDKRGSKGTINTLPPTPSQAEQKPESKAKRDKAKKSRLIFLVLFRIF